MKFFKRGKKKTSTKVLRYIKKRRKSKPLHFTLIDPDKQKPSEAAKLAAKAKEWGSDAIMVGGSHAAQMVFLDDTIKAIKEKTDLPVILFPSFPLRHFTAGRFHILHVFAQLPFTPVPD